MPSSTFVTKALPWDSPLRFAAAVPATETHWVLFHSGLHYDFTGRYSLLALHPEKEISSSDFIELQQALSSNLLPHENAWFGYLGYGLKNRLESLPEDAPGTLRLPDLWMVQFRLILLFDHETRTIAVHARTEDDLRHIPTPTAVSAAPALTIHNLGSTMSKAQYLTKVERILERIRRGDVYQANLTRKFFGRSHIEPLPLFAKLCEVSPAPYSAFMKLGDTHILSSSPERFLHVGADGTVESRPIKGSAPRDADATRDAAIHAALAESTKDRAENLMIVDLMRNDLSRHCTTGSVRVENLFEITSYATVHHMASTIRGQKRAGASTLDVVKGCFPPGSMTGAPKIHAMRICSEMEELRREIYSGAIGWFGGDGSADLSVVIRTLVIQGDYFEFQVGGGIVADSTPESEWRETLVKARGLAKALGIGMEELERL